MISEITFKLKNGMTIEINEEGFCLLNTNGDWLIDGSMFACEKNGGKVTVDSDSFDYNTRNWLQLTLKNNA